MVFSGCVVGMAIMQTCGEFRTHHVKLGIPPTPNEAALDTHALQVKFLRDISIADINYAGERCTVGWGSHNAQHKTPEVVISVRQEGIINNKGKCSGYTKLSFKTGDDIIVKGTLRRVDSYKDGTLNMRYIVVAGMHGKLSANQLRIVS
ncbi:hypothetical protein B0H13DRAFT_2306290 [Mycena leptocephala]|nr:hypothetical protein B0H13DRAFT_2306290 [Mycena leptocephala]